MSFLARLRSRCVVSRYMIGRYITLNFQYVITKRINYTSSFEHNHIFTLKSDSIATKTEYFISSKRKFITIHVRLLHTNRKKHLHNTIFYFAFRLPACFWKRFVFLLLIQWRLSQIICVKGSYNITLDVGSSSVHFKHKQVYVTVLIALCLYTQHSILILFSSAFLFFNVYNILQGHHVYIQRVSV